MRYTIHFCLVIALSLTLTFAGWAQNGQWLVSDGGVQSYRNLAIDPTRSIDDLGFGDFNGDGKTDVFVVAPNGQWLVSDSGTANFRPLSVDASRTIHDLRFGDFNGDGITDVFAVASNGQWFVSDGGVKSYRPLASDNRTIDELRFGDFNGDKITDVFISNPSGQWYVSYSGTQSYQPLAGDGSQNIATLRLGDFNGDGVTDVFTVYPGGQWYVSNSGTSNWRALAGDGSRPLNDLRFGDFNGDGVTDVFTVNPGGQWLVSYSGTQSWRALAGDGSRGVNDLRLGDFNGDGKTDVFAIGVIQNIPPIKTPLRDGTALKLNGSNQSVFVTGINGSFNQISIEAWIKFNPTTSQQSYTILSKGDANTGTIFSVWQDNRLAFYPGVGASSWVQSDTMVPLNQWVHVAVLYDGANAIFLVDGKWSGSKPVSGTINPSTTLSIGNQSGVDSSSFVNMFPGEIDEVRLWNSVRTIDRIMKFIDQPLPPYQTGMAGYWPMNDASGNYVSNAYYVGGSGTLVNGDDNSWVPSGIRIYEGHAFSFDGVKDFIKIPKFPTSQPYITIEAWVKFHPNGAYPSYTIFTKGNPSNGTIFSIWQDQRLAFFAGGNSSWVYSDHMIPLDTWTHVAVSYDGVNARFTISGVLDGVHAQSGSIDVGGTAAIGNQSGDGSDSHTNLFSGVIDELRVWAFAIGQQDIQANMMNTVLYDAPGLLAYWKMDYLYSPTVIDQTLSEYNGAVQNSAGRVLSNFINSVDPNTGMINNGFVSISSLLNGSGDGEYNNLFITDVPEFETLSLPGAVTVFNGLITPVPGAFKLFGLNFNVSRVGIENGKLKATIAPPELVPFLEWTGGNQGDLLIDANNIELVGGRIEIANPKLGPFLTDTMYVEIRPQEHVYGGGAAIAIPGTGKTKKDALNAKKIGAEFRVKDGAPTYLHAYGKNLQIPLGTTGAFLDTIDASGSNLNDVNQMRLNGLIRFVAGKSFPSFNGNVFPLEVNTAGEVTPANGYFDINGTVKVLGFETASSRVAYRPPYNISVATTLSMFQIFFPTVSLSFEDESFTGSLEGKLVIPPAIPIVGGFTLAQAKATMTGDGSFRGDGSITIAEGSPEIYVPKKCIPDCGTFLGHEFCGCIDLGALGKKCLSDICTPAFTIPAIPPTKANFSFNWDGSSFTFPTKRASDPSPYWETAFNKPLDLPDGSQLTFMTNWTRVDKASTSSTGGAVRVLQANDPSTTLHVPDGASDAIFHITFENQEAAGVDAALTLPDGSVLSVNEGAPPYGYKNVAGFARVHMEAKEAYFYLFDPPTGDYKIELKNPGDLGGYSFELLLENKPPRLDLVSVEEGDAPGDHHIQLNASDDEDVLTMHLYLDTDREGLDGFEVKNFTQRQENGKQWIDVNTNELHVQPGRYFFMLAADDGHNAVAADYSHEQIRVTNSEHPDSLLNISAEPIDRGFKISWSPSNNPSITHYTVLYTAESDTGTFENHFIAGANVTSATITGLNNGEPILATVVAGDGDGYESAPEHVVRVVPTSEIGKTPAIIGSRPSKEAIAGYTYHYLPQAFDADVTYANSLVNADPINENDQTTQGLYTWSLLEGPDGMTVDEGSGLVLWKPNDSQLGDHKITIGLFENKPNTPQEEQDVAIQQYTLTVYPPENFDVLDSQAFEFTSLPSLTAIQGSLYSYQAQVIEPEGFTLYWNLISGPTGMAMSADGLLTWDVPQDADGSFVSIQAEADKPGAQYIIEQNFFLDVIPPRKPNAGIDGEWMLHP
ncbi:MAG: hypothetical protein GC154_11085 [bacterium]|nr:hypothetical protein [bacterium]